MYGTLDSGGGDANTRRPLLSEDQQQASRRALPRGGGGRRQSTVLNEILKTNRRRNQDSPAAPVESVERRPKSYIYTLLNPRSDAAQAVFFKFFITSVIVLDLVLYVYSTEPGLDERTTRLLYDWEGITSSIFLVEFVARLITVTESKKYRDLGPIKGRLRYCTTGSAIIDILATFPFFLELITSWDLPTLTYLRAFRLIRILKTNGFAAATSAVYRVIYYNRQILYVALLICVGLVIVTGVMMYYLRPPDAADAEDFRSLGATMYLSTLMLTGQGGPEGDFPWYTKAVVLITGVFSIGMFAIPASMLTWGFEAEAERCARLSYARAKRTTSVPGDDTWSFSSEDYSTDEEYRRIIAGGDDSDDDEAQARAAFELADIDGSGNISLSEFLALSREQAAREASGGSGGLAARVSRVEKIVEENSKKLDKICAMLEAQAKNGN